MREIKFRAKRIDMDRWIYGQYFTTPLTDENSGTKPDAGWFFLCGEKRHCIVQNCVAFVIDPETLGQFTGLTDRNGKEIYEGDIVKGSTDIFDKFTGQVSYAGTSYVIDGVGKYKKIREELNNSYEVIGNIYENPEFLK